MEHSAPLTVFVHKCTRSCVVGVVVDEDKAVCVFHNVFVGGLPGRRGIVNVEMQAGVPSHDGGETGEGSFEDATHGTVAPLGGEEFERRL